MYFESNLVLGTLIHIIVKGGISMQVEIFMFVKDKSCTKYIV